MLADVPVAEAVKAVVIPAQIALLPVASGAVGGEQDCVVKIETLSTPMSSLPKSEVASKRTTQVAAVAEVKPIDCEAQAAAVPYVASTDPKVAPPSVESLTVRLSVPEALM